jgi:very-short-patch-repair endonuclease
LAGIGFRLQHAIGPFIVDFCAPKVKLIIEVDGAASTWISKFMMPNVRFISNLEGI